MFVFYYKSNSYTIQIIIVLTTYNTKTPTTFLVRNKKKLENFICTKCNYTKVYTNTHTWK